MFSQHWEKARTPAPPRLHSEDQQRLNDRADTLGQMIDAAFQPLPAQRRWQERRIAELLAVAEDVAVYRDAYARAGVRASDFKGLPDIARFPVVTKMQLVNASRDARLHPRYRNTRTYPTWSSGSSGLTLAIEFNREAVVTDALQGARQLSLQSAGRAGRDSVTAHYYTCPWVTNNIAGAWRSAFVSSLVPADKAAVHLRELRPDVLTGYPSLLQLLAREVQPGELPLRLVVTNSEQSSRAERDHLEAVFRCPVLDEYSSEELTRIAIELPDKRYYVCEDSVFLEVLHPETREPVADGEWGEAVVTGLLNEAMPFIRYATGDLVRRPKIAHPPWSGAGLDRSGAIGWGQLEAIGGRILDSFIRPDGSMVPSGAMLDVMYRAFHEIGVCVDRFELIQVSPTEARLNRKPSRLAKAETVAAFEARVEELLTFVLGTRVTFTVGPWTRADNPDRKDKRRPIRREFRRHVFGMRKVRRG